MKAKQLDKLIFNHNKTYKLIKITSYSKRQVKRLIQYLSTFSDD